MFGELFSFLQMRVNYLDLFFTRSCSDEEGFLSSKDFGVCNSVRSSSRILLIFIVLYFRNEKANVL